MTNNNLVQAWEFVKLAAESSMGNLQYHQQLQEAIKVLAEHLRAGLADKDGDNHDDSL